VVDRATVARVKKELEVDLIAEMGRSMLRPYKFLFKSANRRLA
jgi:hypothetical protein